MSQVQNQVETRVAVKPDPQVAIAALVEAGCQVTSLQAYLRRALDVIATDLGSLAGTVEIQDGASVIQLESLAEGQESEFWRVPLHELLEDCLADGEPQVRRFEGVSDAIGVALLAVPMGNGYGNGAMTLAVPCRDANQATRQADRLGSLATLASITAKATFHGSRKQALQSDQQQQGTAQAARRAADFESSMQLAITVTNRLAAKEDFEQVALGRVKGKRVFLLAVSGLDHIESKSEAIEGIEQAMHECLDFDSIVAAQVEGFEHTGEGNDVEVTSGLLHEAWHESCRRAPVASIPLRDVHGVVAVISVRRSQGSPFTPEDLASIDKMTAPFGAALPLVERASRSLTTHAVASLLQAPAAFFSYHNVGRKLVFAMLLALGSWSLFGSLPHRVSAPSELTPRHTRAIGVPVDAPLSEAPLAPGTRVQKGDILAIFDTSSLNLEADRLLSEILIKSVEENLAIAEGNPIDVKLAQANAAELQANLKLIRHQIDIATVRAPLDGILVEGDYRERIGDNFNKGEPLFRVANAGTYRLELWIDEADIDVLTQNQVGSFAAFARPEVEFPLTITRIAPAAEKRDDQNAFRVEAKVEINADWTRTGMQGIARIDIGQRRPLWVWTHKLVDHLRMKSWF